MSVVTLRPQFGFATFNLSPDPSKLTVAMIAAVLRENNSPFNVLKKEGISSSQPLSLNELNITSKRLSAALELINETIKTLTDASLSVSTIGEDELVFVDKEEEEADILPTSKTSEDELVLVEEHLGGSFAEVSAWFSPSSSPHVSVILEDESLTAKKIINFIREKAPLSTQPNTPDGQKPLSLEQLQAAQLTLTELNSLVEKSISEVTKDIGKASQNGTPSVWRSIGAALFGGLNSGFE